jgi:hypothetical protein
MRTLLAALVGVLLAGDLLHAQRSPYKDWARLQLEALGGRHAPRVTVRTATGEKTGKLRAAEPDRLIFGDRASRPHIVARTEVCQVVASTHVFRPRTEAMSTAIGAGVIAAAMIFALKGAGTRARVLVGFGWGMTIGSTMKQPPRMLYANPDACPRAD